MDRVFSEALLWWVSDNAIKTTLLSSLEELLKGVYSGRYKRWAFNVATGKWDISLPSPSIEVTLSMVPLQDITWAFYYPLLVFLYKANVGYGGIPGDPKYQPSTSLLVQSFAASGAPEAKAFATEDPSILAETAKKYADLYKRFYAANQVMGELVAAKAEREASPEVKAILQKKQANKRTDILEGLQWYIAAPPEDARLYPENKELQEEQWPKPDLHQIAWVGPLILTVPVYPYYDVEKTITIWPDVPSIRGLTVGTILEAIYNLFHRTPLTQEERESLLQRASKGKPDQEDEELIRMLNQPGPVHWKDILGISKRFDEFLESVVIDQPRTGRGHVDWST